MYSIYLFQCILLWVFTYPPPPPHNASPLINIFHIFQFQISHISHIPIFLTFPISFINTFPLTLLHSFSSFILLTYFISHRFTTPASFPLLYCSAFFPKSSLFFSSNRFTLKCSAHGSVPSLQFFSFYHFLKFVSPPLIISIPYSISL